jgi:hypothetical protein
MDTYTFTDSRFEMMLPSYLKESKRLSGKLRRFLLWILEWGNRPLLVRGQPP